MQSNREAGEKTRQNSLSWWKKAKFVKLGITSYLNNTNPPAIVQSNQYHFLPNKTAQGTASKKEKQENDKLAILRGQ